MTKIAISLLLILQCFTSKAQIITFQDFWFKQELIDNPIIDLNNNNEIEYSEALTVTSLQLYSSEITDLTGLEAFQNLTTLEISSVQVVDLHISTLTNLTALTISYSSVVNLYVTDFPNLITLTIYSTTFVNSNINTLVNLQELNLYDVSVPNLNVANFTNLNHLLLDNCSLTSLNLAPLSQLKIFSCVNNSITNLTLPSTNIIEAFYCNNNQLTSLDISTFTNLKTINCSANPLSSLTLANNTTLQNIYCSDLNLSTFSFHNLPALKKIECNSGQLTSLDLSQIPSLETLTINNNPITELNLVNLPNLTTLNCRLNQLANLNVDNLSSLISLECSENPLTELNLAQSPQLKDLSCFSTSITSIDFSALVNLETLIFNDNPIPSIDFNGLTNLNTLFFGNDTLSQIHHLNALTHLKYFTIIKTTFQTIDLSPLQEITRLCIYNTPLVTIDYSSNPKVREISFENNTELAYLNCKNGKRISQLTTGIYKIKNCPNLTKVCSDPINFTQLYTALTSPSFNNNIVNPLILSYCSFAPSGDHNTLTGTMSLDLNNNGCDANDVAVFNAMVSLTNATTQNGTVSSPAGVYTFYPNQGTYTLSPSLDNDYFTVSPNSTSVTFADANNNSIIQNFCLTPNGIKKDLNVVVIPEQNAVPGFGVNIYIVYKNNGNQTLSGTINLNYNASLESYLSTYFANNFVPTSISPNNLNWDFSNLLPFESRTIKVHFNINHPTDEPPVNIGDLLNYSATVYPLQEDETPNDNVFNLTQTVVNSYDPNDKICEEGSTISTEKIGDYLHYTVRFQNTGTANAENIVVKDVIDTTKFDMNTLQFIGSTSPCVINTTNNNVEFIFQGINLPTEAADEMNSHGSVSFKIKTKNNLVLGDTVENFANIYFDFNFPIVTNTTATTVTALHLDEIKEATIAMAPIPVKTVLYINSKETITAVQLFDMQGRLIESATPNNTITSFDLSDKTAGIYIIKIVTLAGQKIEKIIKN
jgi:uncharacterized repeat protein (TIGR01451 family)